MSWLDKSIVENLMRKILVSECLYGGDPVRYDGKSKEEPHPVFVKWREEGRLIPICPEVVGGLPIPRPDAQRVGNRVINRIGVDVTVEYTAGAVAAVKLARENNVAFAIMKEQSPSCGSSRIYDGTFEGNIIPGAGVATEMLRAAGFRVFSEEELEEAENQLNKIE